MAVKSVNDTAGSDGLFPTLLVFGAYHQMSLFNAPSPTIIQRSAAIEKAMKEIRILQAERQVIDGLRQRIGSNTSVLYDLPLNSDVLVWRRGMTGRQGTWSGPYKLLGLDKETCIIELPSGPTKFRSTTVKPYLTEPQNSETEKEGASEINDKNLSHTKSNLQPNPRDQPR